jgi:hypothetical protein
MSYMDSLEGSLIVGPMELRDRARMLAETGEYEDARAVIFALFKLGYGRAPRTFGLIDRMRLTQLCRSTSKRSRASRS